MANIQRGLILRDDVAHFDGVTRTASRVDATGGSFSGLNFGDVVDVLQVFGGGTSRTASTTSDAVTRLGGATGAFLFSTGTWIIEANVTIPATITCIIPQGTTFSIDSGKTLTLNGQVEAGFYQIFSGSGTVAGLGKNIIFPDWWGALFDGSNDDEPAWNSALTVVGHIFGRAGNTRLGAQLVIKSNTRLELDLECIMRRSWAGTNGTRPENATIKNENAPTAAQIAVDPGPLVPSTFDTDIHISGGQWGHLDDDPATHRGTHVALIAVRGGSFSGRFKTQRSEWCTVFWVEDFHIPFMQIDVAEGSTDVSNDGLHIIAGKNITVGTVSGGCDDDLVVIGSNANTEVDGVTIDAILCDTNGNALKILQIRNGVTSAFGVPTTEVKNITVGKIVGKVAAKRTGIVDILISGTNKDVSLIKNITIDTINCNYVGTVDAANIITIDLSGGENIHFGHVNITGTPIRDIIQATNVVNLTFDRLDAPACSKSGERVADLTTITGFKFDGGDVICSTQAGFKLNDVTGAEIRANITEVGNGFAGIILQGTSDCVVLPGTKITRKSGATTSKGIRSDPSATNTSLIVEGVDLVDIDTTIQLSSVPTTFNQSNNLGHDFDTFGNTDTTPSVAAFNNFFSGTSTRTITDFDDGYTGQEITVISKAAITYDTTSTDLVGSSVDIVTASGDITRWICEDGVTWRLIAFVDVSVDNSGGA